MYRTLLATLLFLGACTGVEPFSDAGTDRTDVSCPESSDRITARGGCSWINGIYMRRTLEGIIDASSCPAVACPFPYDRTGRTTITCATADVEACAWALESGANDCDTYREVMAGCSAACD